MTSIIYQRKKMIPVSNNAKKGKPVLFHFGQKSKKLSAISTSIFRSSSFYHHLPRKQLGRAELLAYYCVSNTATRVRLRLQAACFDTYASGWRLEERELTSQSPTSFRSI